MNKKIIALFLILVSSIFLLTGCFGGGSDDSSDSSSTPYQSTLFKIYDEEGNIIDNAEFSIENVRSSGKDGMYKAHLKAGQTYNLNINSKYFSNITKPMKINRGDKIIKLTLKRDQFPVVAKILVDGSPVSNVNIKIDDEEVTTNQYGNFVAKNVTANEQEITIKADGFNEKNIYFDINANNSILTSNLNLEGLTIDSERVVNLGEIEITKLPQNIEGFTTPGTTVSLVQDNNIYDVANNSGYFVLKNVTVGTYDISFTHPNYYDNTINNIEVLESDIDLGEKLLSPKPANITNGTNSNLGKDTSIFLFEGNKNLSGEETITQLKEDTYNYDSDLTDEELEGFMTLNEGQTTFSFDNLPIGNYSILIKRSGYVDYYKSDIALNPNQNYSLGDIYLTALNTPTGNLDVEVSSGAGGTLDGAEVIVSELPSDKYNEDGEIVDSNYNNKLTPNANWQDIQEGTYSLSAYKEGYYINKENITILDGNDVNGKVSLIPIPERTDVKVYRGTVSHGENLYTKVFTDHNANLTNMQNNGYKIDYIVSFRQSGGGGGHTLNRIFLHVDINNKVIIRYYVEDTGMYYGGSANYLVTAVKTK